MFCLKCFAQRTTSNRPFSWEAKSTVKISFHKPASSSVSGRMYRHFHTVVVVLFFLFLPPWGRGLNDIPVVWHITAVTTWSMTIPRHFAHNLLHIKAGRVTFSTVTRILHTYQRKKEKTVHTAEALDAPTCHDPQHVDTWTNVRHYTLDPFDRHQTCEPFARY